MVQDLRYGLRKIVQARAWTAVVVLSLALGVGANTALFSLVEAVLLRDVAVPDADRLVYLNWVSGPNGLQVNLTGNSDTDEATGRRQSTSFSTLTFERIRAQTRTLARVFAFAPMGEANLSDGAQAEITSGQFVSGNFFEALGIKGLRGRAIVEDDDRPGASPVIVISDALWQRRYERDLSAIGRTLTVNGLPFTIIGIAPAGFTGLHGFSFSPDFSIPLAFESRLFPEDEHARPWSWWLRIMGRLDSGVSRPRVQAELERVVQLAALDGWQAAPTRATRSAGSRDLPTLQVLDGSGGLGDQVRNVSQLMASFAGVAGILLLIVCVNVANMVLARSTSRQREIGVRLAMGASRARVVRMLLAETLLLCLLAATLGLLFAAWAIDVLALFVSHTVGVNVDLRLDPRVFAFALTTSLLIGVACGLTPALRATRADLATYVKQDAANLLGKRPPLTRVLLVSQLALSLMLLVTAGLLARSVWQMQRVDVGFGTGNLLLFEVNPEALGYDDARTTLLYEEVIRRLELLPGVRAATTSDYPLVSASGSGNSISVQGREPLPDGGQVRRLKVRSNFMQTMGVHIVQGRDLRAQDVANAPPVALVNETLARSFFPDQRPVGQRFGFGSRERSGDIEIVGVVRDARMDEVRTANPPTVYLPYPQRVHGSATFEVRTAGSPMTFAPAIRELLHQVAPDLPVVRFRTQRQQVQSGFLTEQMLAGAAGFFSTIALLLACIGLYGMMAYSVARRTSEIAIRIALGARQDRVIWLVLREVVLLVAIGVTLGAAGALAVTRTMEDLLFRLTPQDPLTLAGAALILIFAGILAGYLPARRAARVQPWVALRYE